MLHDPANTLKDRKITLDTGKTTFWEALEKFCTAAGVSEGDPNANAFVHWPADITPKTQRTEKIKINILRDWNGELNVCPLLIVILNSLRGCEATQRTQQEISV